MLLETAVCICQEETVTRNFSSSGIYFITDQSFEVGEDLNLSLDFPGTLPGKTIRLVCQGEVVRLEQYDGRLGIAAKINSFQYIQ